MSVHTNATVPFYQIPVFVVQDKRLTSDEKMVFTVIYGYLKSQTTCWYTNEDLANIINKSVDTIKRILKNLTSLKFLNIIGLTFRRKFQLGSEFIENFNNIKNKQSDEKLDTRGVATPIVQSLNYRGTDAPNYVHPTPKVGEGLPLTRGTDALQIKEHKKEKLKKLPTGDVDQILNKDYHPEPVVVMINSFLTANPPMADSVPIDDEVPQIFISKEVDDELLQAYYAKPVVTDNIRDPSSFLSACKYAIEYRAPDVSLRGRVKGIIGFVRDGSFDEPGGWTLEIIKQRNAREAEKNIKIAEIETVRAHKLAFKDVNLPANVSPDRAGFRSLGKMLKDDINKEVSYAVRKNPIRQYRNPEELRAQEA